MSRDLLMDDTFNCPHSSAPVLNTQCNWFDIIKKPKEEVWVSCKYRGETSLHGKVHASGEGHSLVISEGFDARWRPGIQTIFLRHIKSNCNVAFIAPQAQYNNIHKKSIVSLHVTSGDLAVSACSDNQLLVWDTKLGTIRRVLEGHPCDVYCCRFFPSGVVVLSGGADLQLKIWSAETGQCPVTLKGHTGSIMDVAIVDRGRNVISVSKDGSARLWDCGTASCLAVLLEEQCVINCCTITSASNKVSLEPPEKPPSDREIATENKILTVGCENGTVIALAIQSRKVLSRTTLPSAVNCIASVNEDLIVVGCQDGRVLLSEPINLLKPLFVWFESNSPALSLYVHSAGIFVGRADGTCTGYPQKDSQYSPKRLALTGPEFDPIYDIACDGRSIYTACRDGIIRKYEVQQPSKEL